MRTVLKKILTAMRGGVNELGEAVVDGQGNRILGTGVAGRRA